MAATRSTLSSFMTISFVATLLMNKADAFWVVNCTVLTKERIDPIVSPGTMSSHQHIIAGPSTFSSKSTNSDLRTAQCSSCDTSQDLSAYWVPQLYAAPSNLVGADQDTLVTNGAIAVPTGKGKSIHIYYRLIDSRGERNDSSMNPKYPLEPIQPFPENFRMVIPELLIYNKSISSPSSDTQPVKYFCLFNQNNNSAASIEETKQSTLDPTSCAAQGLTLRASLMTPSCWDGVNIDPPNHFSHVSYPLDGLSNSACPSTHPVRIPTLVFIIQYETSQVKYLTDKGWRLVFPRMPNQILPNGMPIFHMDMMNGWNQDQLIAGITQCRGVRPCPIMVAKPMCSTLKTSPKKGG